MYAGGDSYEELAEYDPNGVFTTIDWREPLVDWIKSQNSTREKPLDQAVKKLVH